MYYGSGTGGRSRSAGCSCVNDYAVRLIVVDSLRRSLHVYAIYANAYAFLEIMTSYQKSDAVIRCVLLEVQTVIIIVIITIIIVKIITVA